MLNGKIITEVANKIKNYSYNKEIEDYLRSEGVAEADFTSIMDAAQSKLAEERAVYFSKRNKRFFYVWLSLALITLVLFLFVLPYKNIGGSETILAILGTGLFCFFCFLALAYNKTWKPDFVQKHETPNIQYSFLVIFLIPAVIIYFIFSWRFTAGQQQVLKQTQEKAIGTIVSGKTTQVKRLRGGGFEFSEVTVEFKTKDGTDVVAAEDLSAYELKSFYKGQKVELIYSKNDPQNIDLLVNESHVKELMGSEERDITPDDLMNLMTAQKENIAGVLNKIKYGWQYDDKNSGWANEKDGSALIITGNTLTFISKSEFLFTYPKYFLQMGFKQTNAEKTNGANFAGKKIFEKDGYTVTIEMISDGGSSKSVTAISRK
jgi:hypothetical protein